MTSTDKGKTDEKKEFVDSTFRKKWDKDYYEQRARDREAGLIVDDDVSTSSKEKKLKLSEEPLGYFKAREEDIDLSSKLGKSHYIEGVTPENKKGGLYCDICELTFKDSIGYYDHINSKRHIRLAYGASMRVETSTLSAVQQKLRQKKEQLQNKKNPLEELKKKKEEDYQKMIQKLEEKESKEKQQQQPEKDKSSSNEQTVKNDNSSSKEKEIKSKPIDNIDEEKEEKETTDKQEQKQESEEKEEIEYEQDEFDYASLGLPTDFGTTKKKK